MVSGAEAFNLTKSPKSNPQKKESVKTASRRRKKIISNFSGGSTKSLLPGKKTTVAAKIARLAAVFLIVLAFLVLFTTSGAYAYKNQFGDKAYFGTRLLGEDVGGKRAPEIERIINKKIDQIEFSFIVDNQIFKAKPSEMGLSFKAKESAWDAVQRGKSDGILNDWLYALASFTYKITPAVVADGPERFFLENIEVKHEIDLDTLSKFTDNLSIRYNSESQNANLIISGTDVQVVPAVYGRKIVADSIARQITEGIRNADSPKVNIEFEKVNPSILEKDTADSVAAAKKIIDTSVKFSYKDKVYLPDKKIVASWITFKEQDDGGKTKLVPVVDQAQVAKYIFSIGKEINIPAVNRKITIKNGVEQIVDQVGKDGLSVDYNKVSLLTAGSLNAGKPVMLELPTVVVAAKTQVNNVLVADWSKYIEVNISTQTMCAYLAGGIQQNCWAVTTGQNNVINGVSTNTPIGTFIIRDKAGEGGAPGPYGGGVCMPNPPYATPLCGINFVSYFTPQGHAIHEAWWRTSFGGQDYKWNGSHGCVNATYDIAKWIYYWAPIGTPVIIHY